MTGNGAFAPRDTIQALGRGMEILDVLSQSSEGMLAKTISATTGFNISTCYHLLNTLVATGYATKQDDQRFRLSNKLCFPSPGLLDQARAVNVLDEHLSALGTGTSETAYLGLRDGDEIVVTAIRRTPNASAGPLLHVGYTGAGHALALGKALLADMDEPEVDQYVENHGLEKLTDRTVDKGRQLLEDLTVIRQRGYALDMEELVPGICCVAAPVSDSSSRVVGALAISVQSSRFRRHDDRLISRTVASCHAATEALESAGITLPNLGAKLAVRHVKPVAFDGGGD